MIDSTKKLIAEILTEQFIPDHLFVYLAKGRLQCFDADKSYTFKAGDCFIARKNRLARYKVVGDIDDFEPVLFCFDEAFLKDFQKKHNSLSNDCHSKDTYLKIQKTVLVNAFIRSLKPYYKSANVLEEAFEDLKYEELLIILLKIQPELANLLFDFGNPAKIDLEEFMMKNYKFNVSLQRFAFLTGRSISSFKRDFQTIFNDTPSRWLVQKRLEEAHFLIDIKRQKPSDIYLDLGFEDLSHFSYAFKKKFGQTPTELIEKKKPVTPARENS